MVDGGFEGGPGGGAWIEFSSNFGTPVCDAFGCGTGGGTGPNSGTFWTWFGGIAGVEDGSMEQLVTVPTGNTQLSFFYELPALNAASGASDFMNVRMDGDLLFSVDATSTAFIGYVQETISLAAYADDGNHTLRFESGITGALGAVSNFFVDDVAIDSVQEDCR